MTAVAVGDDTLNSLGRTWVRLIWFINNVRLKRVGTLIAVLIGFMFVTGGYSVTIGVRTLHDFRVLWEDFDATTANKMLLLNDLGRELGFGGVIHHFKDYVLLADPRDAQEAGRSLARLRAVIPAYGAAGVDAGEAEALAALAALAQASEAKLEMARQAHRDGKPVAEIARLTAIDAAPGRAALTALHDRLVKARYRDSDAVEQATWSLIATVLGVFTLNGLLLGVLAVFLYWFTRQRLVYPLDALRTRMLELCRGRRDIEVPFLTKTDEIGDMARSLQVFKENAVTMDRLNAEERVRQQEKERRHQATTAHIHTFEDEVAVALQALAARFIQLRETAGTMRHIAHETQEQSQEVSRESCHALNNIETIAAATEQLSSSVDAIGEQMHSSTVITHRAVDEVDVASGIVGGLSATARTINEVVDLIKSIAERTNLLALNATIEANRAGTAGKGFAVVANEVKSLATQTARATEEIMVLVRAIQGETLRSVAAIHGIGGIITEVDTMIATVAAAVEQQGAATHEIARNIQEAASSTQVVTHKISGVSAGTIHVDSSADDVLLASDVAIAETDRLRHLVDGFLRQVQAA